MSRLARKPIIVPVGVSLEIEGNVVKVKGPKGTLERKLPLGVSLQVRPEGVRIEKGTPSFEGLMVRLLQGMIEGVTRGWQKQVELSGIGFRVEAKARDLVFQLGLTHPVTVAIPDGLEVKIEKNTVTISGNNKELVGQFTARLRSLKPPEPYKGKGIRYVGETIKLKPGKQVKGATGPAK